MSNNNTLPKLEQYQARIDNFLANKLEQLTVNDERLIAAMRYGLLLGGKRMRPYLVYLTAETLKLSLHDADAIAGALECIHAYSLIHDDLPAMDNDDLRRGQPTCHKAFDEATAILAGDSLQTLAFSLLSEHLFEQVNAQQQVNLVKKLAQAAGYLGMCGGQALDISATNKHIVLEQLAQIHRLKTGALLSAALLMPASCCDQLTNEHVQALELYAQNIGLAYQVRDDIIDIISSSEQLGKPAGSDLAAHKSTYPALLGLDGAQQKAEQLYQEALQALAKLPYNTEQLAAFATFIVTRNH